MECLSINAEISTEAHIISVKITNLLPLALTNKLPISSMSPASLIPPMITNNPANNRIVGKSISFIASVKVLVSLVLIYLRIKPIIIKLIQIIPLVVAGLFSKKDAKINSTIIPTSRTVGK